jgi:hypothetical protein
MSKLSFVSGKALRDSTGKVYVIFQGSSKDQVIEIEETSKAYIVSRAEITTTPTGEQQVVNVYTKVPDSVTSLTFKIVTAGALKGLVNITLDIPTSKQQLPEPYDELTQNLAVTQDGTNNTNSIADTLYYKKSIYNKLYVFPESSSRHLDTSTVKDYYYISDGAAAYLGSNELQNSFLNALEYTAGGYDATQIGRFRGGDKGVEIRYSCYTAKNKSGPAVFGVTHMVDSYVIQSANQITVCTNPASSNYYLTNCEGETWPCVPTGSTMADDCLGNVLTAEYINNYIVQSGDCCETCDGFTVNLVLNDASNTTAADGSIDITIAGATLGGGSANYILTAIDLDGGPITGYSGDGTSGAVAIGDGVTTISAISMPSGKYQLIVADDAGCLLTKYLILGAVAIGQDESWGCGPSGSSAAINYEGGSIVDAFETDALCVYCNATTGLLETGTESAATTPILSSALGAWAEMDISIEPAGVNPASGVAVANGTASISQLTFNSFQLLGTNPALYNEFSVAEWFSGSATASAYKYILYKIPNALDYGSQGDGDNVKTNITGASGVSTIDTYTNVSGGIVSISALAHGRYVVILSYVDSAGTLEYEQCYAVKEFKIGLKGCNEPGAVNYNADVTIPGDVCISPECNPSIFNTPFQLVPTACGVNILENDWLGNNPVIFQAFSNGYEVIGTSGLPTGPLNPGSVAATAYILENILCGHMPIFYPSIAANPEGLGNAGGANSSAADFYTASASNGVTIPPWITEDLSLQYEDFGADAELNNSISGLHLICPIFKISFADGEFLTITQTAQGFMGGPYTYGLQNLLFGQGDTTSQTGEFTSLGAIPCGYILEHGDITQIQVVIAYGQPGVWESVYQSIWTNSGDDYFNTVDYCQNLDCSGDVTTLVAGCTDPEAVNYNIEATTNDGSCEYPPDPDIPGCTDPVATNYNAEANLEDDSCEYITLDILGCTDPQASNYEPTATIEDGSCIYDGSGGLDDCTTLTDFVNNNEYTVFNNLTITNTTSTSNTIGSNVACVSDYTGSVVVNLPSTSGLTINNPNGLYAVVILTWLDPPNNPTYLGQPQMQASFATGFVSAYNFVTTWGQDTTAINVSDLIDPDSVSSFTFSNLSNGHYVVQVMYTASAIENSGGTTVNAPGWATNSQNAGILNAFCGGTLASPVVIGLDVCEGSTDVYGCTDPAAENFNSLATVDDSTCDYPCNPCEGECICPDGTYSVDCCVPDPVSGCTDVNALNFNPAANMEDGSCTYPPCPVSCVDFVSAACIPNRINSVIGDVEKCLANAGNSFYTKLISGLSSDCSTMEAWKIIIILELLKKKGLPCIYNCADSETPDTPGSRCIEKWTGSGSSLWNTGDTDIYTVGTVVKHHDIIYQAVSSIGLNLDPSTTVSFPDNPISGWEKCVDAVTYSDTTNYLQKFTSFAQSYCKNCGVPSYVTEAMEGIHTNTDFTAGGSLIQNEGLSFNSGDSNK